MLAACLLGLCSEWDVLKGGGRCLTLHSTLQKPHFLQECFLDLLGLDGAAVGGVSPFEEGESDSGGRALLG